MKMYEACTPPPPDLATEKLSKWPLVSVEEVKAYSNHLMPAKASCPDRVLPELLKANKEWWATFLATLH